MILSLHDIQVRLHSKDPAITLEWQRLFSGSLMPSQAEVQYQLQFELIGQLPDLPAAPPIFVDESEKIEVGLISVYALPSESLLIYYHDGAMVELSPGSECIQGKITAQALAHGRLEDITFTSLAPALRRQGLYLVHAFAASKNGRALLLIGTSGSGKTTTGLNLLLHGWRLLANDVLMLKAEQDGIVALPTPGGINIRPQTISQLPQLQTLFPTGKLPAESVALSSHELIKGRWSEPAQAAWLCFPHITHQPATSLSAQSRAVGLARLMEESIDRWDETAVPDHIAFLETLCRQTAVFDLQLGQDFAEITGRIEEILR